MQNKLQLLSYTSSEAICHYSDSIVYKFIKQFIMQLAIEWSFKKSKVNFLKSTKIRLYAYSLWME